MAFSITVDTEFHRLTLADVEPGRLELSEICPPLPLTLRCWH